MATPAPAVPVNDDDPTTVSNRDIVDGLRTLRKERGYRGDVESIDLQEGEDAVNFERIVAELKDGERVMILVEMVGAGADPDKPIGHWLTVAGANEENRRLSVTDPSTNGNNSPSPAEGGRVDTYDVDAGTFDLDYEFDGARTGTGKTQVHIVDIIKVSNVEDAADDPEGAGGGGEGAVELEERDDEVRVILPPVLMEVLVQNASQPTGVDPAFFADPILGATLRIAELTLENPSNVLHEGALLSPGSISIDHEDVVLFSAHFGSLTMFDGLELAANQAILRDLTFNNVIGSSWLDAFRIQFELRPIELLPQLFLTSLDPPASLLSQLEYFQAVPTGPVGNGVFPGAMPFTPSVGINPRSITGRSVAIGIDVPEPATLLLTLAGIVLLRVCAGGRLSPVGA
jgi:hypothetical protein